MSLDDRSPIEQHRTDRRLSLEEVEAEERAERYEELRVRDLCESIDATEAEWVETMACMPPHIRDIHYATGPG